MAGVQHEVNGAVLEKEEYQEVKHVDKKKYVDQHKK